MCGRRGILQKVFALFKLTVMPMTFGKLAKKPWATSYSPNLQTKRQSFWGRSDSHLFPPVIQ